MRAPILSPFVLYHNVQFNPVCSCDRTPVLAGPSLPPGSQTPVELTKTVVTVVTVAPTNAVAIIIGQIVREIAHWSLLFIAERAAMQIKRGGSPGPWAMTSCRSSGSHPRPILKLFIRMTLDQNSPSSSKPR